MAEIQVGGECLPDGWRNIAISLTDPVSGEQTAQACANAVNVSHAHALSSSVMTNVAAVEQLDSVQYLYLRELSEPHDNSLKLVVEESVLNQPGIVKSDPVLDAILKDTSPIESVEGCRVFELYWKRYAAYLVTEELVGSNSTTGYDDECYTGKLLRVYSKSHFLDHVARDTGGHLYALQHYKLVCLNHLVDVAAYAPPEVRVLASHTEVRSRTR